MEVTLSNTKQILNQFLRMSGILPKNGYLKYLLTLMIKFGFSSEIIFFQSIFCVICFLDKIFRS